MAKTKGKAKVAKSAAKAKPRTQSRRSDPPKPARPAKRADPPRPAPRDDPPQPVKRAAPPDPPAPAQPAPPRDELAAARDVGRLIRYGERFGAYKIDTRMWTAPGSLQPTTLPVPSGTIAICDPAVPKSWRVLDRPSRPGQFRVMLSVATAGEAGARSDAGEKLAALVIHTGLPPIARWTVAHPKGKKPKEPTPYPVTSGWIALMDAEAGSPGPIATPPASGFAPVEIPLTDGRKALAVPCGNGDYIAYWAVDAADKPIALVIDFDVFTQKEWKAKPAT